MFVLVGNFQFKLFIKKQLVLQAKFLPQKLENGKLKCYFNQFAEKVLQEYHKYQNFNISNYVFIMHVCTELFYSFPLVSLNN